MLETADRARRHHDREPPAAGARAPEAALGRHRADQPAPRSIARSPATARPAPTATGRASTSPPISAAPASSMRRATKAARPASSLPAQGDRATAMTLVAAILLGLRQRDQHRQRLLGRHVALRQRRLGQRHDGWRARWSAPQLPPRQSPDKPAQCADQPLPHQGRSLAAAPAWCATTGCGAVLHAPSSAPDLAGRPALHRARRRAARASLELRARN